MKKIVIISMVILIFSLFSPYTLLAATSNLNNESEKVVSNNETGEEFDADSNSESVNDESEIDSKTESNAVEPEQGEEQDKDNDETESTISSGSDANDKNDNEEVETNAEDDIEDDDSTSDSDNSRDNNNVEAETDDERDQEDDDSISESEKPKKASDSKPEEDNLKQKSDKEEKTLTTNSEEIGKKTSRLGHIKSASVRIYKTPRSDDSLAASEKYTNTVYYIKKQADMDGDRYYLISEKPSSEEGVVGWVQADDLTLNDHERVDTKKKTKYFTGKGSAYSKAWGGSQDSEYDDMSDYQSEAFHINKTEKVGSNTWYRGKFDGKTIWLHESYLTSEEKDKTSKLGHFKSKKATIYETIGDRSTAFTAGEEYTNQVYYIKQEAKVNEQMYYLISLKPSSDDEVVGWVQEYDLTLNDHERVDTKKKTKYFTGKGSAYSKAWGGSQDSKYDDMSDYQSEAFHINKTEKVGSNTWYRGKFDGKTIWLHESYLGKGKEINNDFTTYDLTLDKMTDIQMKANPQTDKGHRLWIREDAIKNISNGKGTVDGDNWNLRRGPGTSYSTDGQVNDGDKLDLKSSKKVSGYKWYHVRNTSGWVTPEKSDLQYYLDHKNFDDSLKSKLQFLKISKSTNIDANEVNEKILKDNGILEGKAESFTEGSQKHGVNEIYLIAHALLETGNGTSDLAKGKVKHKGKKVYNMYGIGADDENPKENGAEYAYDAGWFTPEDAIKGGAEFVSENYIQTGQDTLYKMRWNPSGAEKSNEATHQYASDIKWAYKQSKNMYEMYALLDNYNMMLDIPKYQ